MDDRCEGIIQDFLLDKHGEVVYPISTDDVTVLVEQYAELDSVADLSAEDTDDMEVQGETKFGSHPLVRIAAALWEPSRENRLRTTLTHELGHVIFHSDLIVQRDPNQLSWFDRDRTEAIQCLRAGIIHSTQTDWFEWQAGYASGSFLMPLTALRKMVLPLVGERRVSGRQGAMLVTTVARRFQVSIEAAHVRLDQLGYLGGVSLFES